MTRKADPRETRLPVPRGELPPFTPVPRKCARHDGWTATRQRRFIEALADSGSVESACRAVNMSTVGAYHLRRHPQAKEFSAAWEAALDLGVQKIEDVAMDRALNGVEVPVFSYGKHVGDRKVYNDRLLMFMLRNRAPKRFADGGAKGLSATDKQTVARLKKEWRQEWEREQHVLKAQHRKSEGDGLMAKLDMMHRRWFALLSPATQRAYALFRAMERRDAERDWQGEASGLPPAESEALLAEVEWLYARLCSDKALTRRGMAKAWRLIEVEAAAWTVEVREGVVREGDGLAN